MSWIKEDEVYDPANIELQKSAAEASRTEAKETEYDGVEDLEQYRGRYNGLHQHAPLDFEDESS